MNETAFVNNLSIYNNSLQPRFLTANDIINRYRITKMTLWRWINSDEVNFPKPVYISKRRYFKIADIVKWESERANETGAR